MGGAMLYIAYLDEFGHIGPYISHTHPQHKTHPVFGLGGFVLPYHQVRQFATYFFQLKNRLLEFELNRSGIHPAKWEKKGSSLYTVQNVKKYRALRQMTFRLLNKIQQIKGFTIYVGLEKRRAAANHNAKQLYHSVLRESIKRIDQECQLRDAQFLLMLDQQEENVLRAEIVETASIEMYGANARTCLLEPPVQAESHLYQTLQCADWLCGLFGRLAFFQCDTSARPELAIFDQYFGERIRAVSTRSGIRVLN